MKVTVHFDSNEFNCRDGPRYPKKWLTTRLKPLCEQLEVLRTELGGYRMTILSGYRTKSYNRKVGGARYSQHVLGRAADVVIHGVSPDAVHAAALKLYEDGRLLIGGLALYRSSGGFVHIDIRESERLVRWEGGKRTLA